MIAIILFIYGIYCFEAKRDRVIFYLILQYLALDAYSMLYWDYSIIRFDDLALIMVLYSFFREGIYKKSSPFLKKMIYAYLIIILLSVFVSYFYYQIPIIQVFKGARTSLFVLAFFDLIDLRYREYRKLFYFIFVLSSIAATLYCYTIIAGKIPENARAGIGFLGIPRSFNFPPLAAYNCIYSVFILNKKKKIFIPVLILSFVTLLLIQSRGMIISVLIALVVGTLLKANKSNRVLIFIMAVSVSTFLLTSLIFKGDTGDKTMNDISKISTGEFAKDDFEHESDATFSYRLNLLAISIIKTVDNPVRLLFGSGLFVEMPISYFERWNMIGTFRMARDGYTYFSPDISFSNIIYNIGFLGLFVYLAMIYSFWKVLLNRANGDRKYEIAGVAYLLYMLLVAFDGSRLTWPNNLLIPIIFVQYAIYKNNMEIGFKSLVKILCVLKKKSLPEKLH